MRPGPLLRSLFLSVSASIFLGTALAAHDLWLEPGEGGYVLHYGHIHPTAYDEISIPLDQKKIGGGLCVTGTGRTALAFSGGKETASARGSCDAVLLEYRGGYYTKTVEGTLPLPRNQTTNPLHGWISYEYLKTLEHWTDATRRPIGARLELTPVTEPAQWIVGNKITLLVTANGTPVKGIVVALYENPRGITDFEGKVNIRIREKGIQIFEATQKIPLNRADADEEIHTALLQMEVPR